MTDTEKTIAKLVSGKYIYDNYTITVNADDINNVQVKVVATTSYKYVTEWKMSGVLDTETGVLAYSDCSMNEIMYDTTGNIVKTNNMYVNGIGKINFAQGFITWFDCEQDTAKDLIFKKV